MQQLPLPNFDDINLDKPMKTGKAKGWLGEYHWVRRAIKADERDNTDEACCAWCKENFGKSGARWFEKNGQFYFKDEKDMTMFILRWS